MAKNDGKDSKSTGSGAHASKKTAKDTGYVGTHRKIDGDEKNPK